MVKKIRPVKLNVHPAFFDGWFEPQRRKAEKMTGKRLSQINFSSMIVDKWNLKRRKTFLPKEFRDMKFYTL